jgi:hypothetical protein
MSDPAPEQFRLPTLLRLHLFFFIFNPLYKTQFSKNVFQEHASTNYQYGTELQDLTAEDLCLHSQLI